MSLSSDIASELRVSATAAPQDGVGLAPRALADRKKRASVRNFSEAEFSRSWFLTGVEFLVLILWSLATGVAYHRLALNITGDVATFSGTGMLIALLMCGAERIFGRETRVLARRRLSPLLQILLFWCASFLLLTFLAFAFRVSLGFSRGAVLVFFFSGLPVLLLARQVATKLFAGHLYKNSLRWSDAVVVGCSPCALADAIQSFQDRGCSGLSVVQLDTGCNAAAWPIELDRALKLTTNYAHKAGPGAIYVCAQDFPEDRFHMLLTGLQLLPRAVRIIPDAVTAHLLSFPLRSDVDGVSVEVQGSPLTSGGRVAKRAFDLLAAATLFIFLLPLFLVVALAIKLDSRGPVLFRQTRLGYRGQPFTIIKFRTMTVLENGDAIAQARQNDARVTRVGRFLRKSSLDELPQLINVIRGSMSLVGPRPHAAAAHDKLFSGIMPNYELRQHVKPGITGWAQVHGLRGETSTTDLMWRRVEFDIWYAKNANLLLDAEILLRTIGVVLGQKNAY